MERKRRGREREGEGGEGEREGGREEERQIGMKLQTFTSEDGND